MEKTQHLLKDNGFGMQLESSCVRVGVGCACVCVMGNIFMTENIIVAFGRPVPVPAGE